MTQPNVCQNHFNEKALSLCHHCQGYFCSKCLNEGREFYFCSKPDCLKALQDETKAPSEENKPNPPMTMEDWVTVAIYYERASAEAGSERLREHGIESRIVDERTIPPGLPPDEEPEGNVELQVRAADTHSAMKVVGFNL